jgi:hypothetical protein
MGEACAISSAAPFMRSDLRAREARIARLEAYGHAPRWRVLRPAAPTTRGAVNPQEEATPRRR